MSDVVKAREILIRKLRGLSTRSSTGALSIGAGVVGQIPFYITIVGLGITFLANALVAFQQNIRNDQTKQEPYFVFIMIGLALFVLGLLLSLNQLSEVITFIQNSAEIGSSSFVWRTPEQEIMHQADALSGLSKPAPAIAPPPEPAPTPAPMAPMAQKAPKAPKAQKQITFGPVFGNPDTGPQGS